MMNKTITQTFTVLRWLSFLVYAEMRKLRVDDHSNFSPALSWQSISRLSFGVSTVIKSRASIS
ncbi:hypothetical protein PR003_g66 [Phytophthora rubi]|uniref:Uncharacterized protein n=1 Tax=Phytophthora rubi TaxID=129364 RepID=A0A6A3NSU7_9STRA|nr:hypothetical protein PR002_g2091 [Phytophthora rubi]KAE9052879.1 hypothetical protein PR001_g101 [Phytophthora rubi]KAE9360610.1 hypothetical protein PR003_g66 [Phytophthora rubi]